MTQWVIVAIPSEQDYVWKLSSEKKPHMTLLFLGEQEGNLNEVRMASFIKHVADQTIDRFGMDVDHRGPLGSDNADVLFFGKHNVDKLQSLRNTLLQQDDIFAAYNSTDQFPQWTPHLTLGYPSSPANPDERDYPGVNWVHFDKLALWTSDSEGYEFLLKEKEQELAMSDITLDGILSHYGVPGMHWGSRKASGGSTGSQKGFFNNPSVAKAVVLGSYGKKSSYTNPAALATRKTAGKLRIVAALASVGSNLISTAGRGNSGAQAVAGVLGLGAGGVALASIIKGAEGASMERNSRG